jgi:RecG-like helicase
VAVAKRRLKILRETEDRFRIAEEDLRLRGASEVLGTRQSGFRAEPRLADLASHEELVALAHGLCQLSWRTLLGVNGGGAALARERQLHPSKPRL